MGKAGNGLVSDLIVKQNCIIKQREWNGKSVSYLLDAVDNELDCNNCQ